MLGSPASGRAPRLVSADDHVGSLSVDGAGTASAVEVRGTVHWLTHRDGPATALAVTPGVRARYPQVLGPDGQVVWATDADGVDALEIGGGDPAGAGRRDSHGAPQARRPASSAASAGSPPRPTAAWWPSPRRTGGCASSTWPRVRSASSPSRPTDA